MRKFLFVALVLFGLQSTVAHPETYLVCPDGTGDFMTLQAAIDAAVAGDSVLVDPATYEENIIFRGVDIAVCSVAGPEATTISSVSHDVPTVQVNEGESLDLLLDGFTITGATGEVYGDGIACRGGSITVRNCRIHGNGDEGIAVHHDGSSLTVLSTVVWDNGRGSNDGIGILQFSDGPCGSLVIENCTVYDNDEGGVLSQGDCASVQVSNSIISNNGRYGLRARWGGEMASYCNDVWANESGGYSGVPVGIGDISEDPLFCNPDAGDYHLLPESPCADAPDCGLIGALPVGCDDSQHVVMPDGSGEFPTIQSAVDVATEGDAVLLGDGVFLGDGNRDIDLSGKSIAIRSMSGEPGLCVIDCQGSASDPHRGFRMEFGETNEALLEGVTIRGGYVTEPDGLGGAVLCVGSSLRLVNCVLEENQAIQGGGVWCEDEATPILEGCVLDGNVAQYGGGLGCDFSLPLITNCTFIENQATGTLAAGAGIECWNHALVTVENSILAFGLAGQGVRCHETASIELSCSDVFGNANGDWVGYIEDQLGQAENICQDPQFCDLAGGDYYLWNYSPCTQYSCGLIGALPVNCWDAQDARSDFPGAVHPTLAVTPNPTLGQVSLRYSISPGLIGEIAIFDPTGRQVASLAVSGEGTASWRPEQPLGPGTSGIYFARLRAGSASVVRALTILR